MYACMHVCMYVCKSTYVCKLYVCIIIIYFHIYFYYIFQIYIFIYIFPYFMYFRFAKRILKKMTASQFQLNIGKIPVSTGDYCMQVVSYSKSSQWIVQSKPLSIQEKEINMKGQDKSKWHKDLKKQIFHHKTLRSF